MSRFIFQIGEVRPEFQIPVINERAVRAAAGILFFLGLISFMNAWLVGNFQPTRVFVVSFLIDFTLRVFVGPRFAPTIILGQWIVRKQQPQWSGAPQKRFAWTIGWVLAAVMLYLVVLNKVVGPINLIVCSICLLLLFFETAFGICVGCKIYNVFNKDQAQLCPGGACEVPAAQVVPASAAQVAIVLGFALAVGAAAQWVDGSATLGAAQLGSPTPSQATTPMDSNQAARCKVPDFAKAIGHEEKWKLHNNCL